MKVPLSGAVSSTATWPSSLRPVAWVAGTDMIRFKLELYHIKNKVCAMSRRDVGERG